MNPEITVHFDGGTPCNIPSRGFGIGYGSYAFNGGTPVRVNHGVPCSNNAAEVLTLCCALEGLKAMGCPPETHIHVTGDSQTALSLVKRVISGRSVVKKKKKASKGGTPEYQESKERLYLACDYFENLTAEWLPREHAVAAFGH